MYRRQQPTVTNTQTTTTAGSTQAVSSSTETADPNLVKAGPATGTLGTATYRALVDADLPVVGASHGGAGTTNGILKANGSGVVSAATWASGILKGANSTSDPTAATGADVAALLTGTNIVTSGTVTSPSVDYENNPASHGYLAWTHSVNSYQANSAVAADGLLNVVKIWVPKTITVTGIGGFVAATLLTNADNYNGFGLYSSAGVLIAKTGDQSGTWASGTYAIKSAALIAEAGQSLTINGGAGVFVYGAVLANTNGGTTPAWSYHASTANLLNAGLVGTAGAPTYVCGNLPAQASLPSSLTTLTAGSYAVWLFLY